ncbi:MAG: hypothetical protein QG632_378, partial [Candidatus Dependentiae bacterium]|nr:hypothetical protein [Candidatus Dependentiae bacterium]
LSSSVRSLLRTATDDEPLRNAQFRGFYGVSVAAMIKDVIAQKNMIYRERLTHSSFGDISVLAAMHAAPLGVERWSWSAELLIPSEKTIETAYFYPLIPESLGCLSARISTGIIGKMTVFGSPYVTASGQVYFSSAINCRVPRLVTVTAATALPETEVFGGELSFFPVATFSTPETTLPDFAGQTTTAKVRPGFVFDFQAGSIIHPSISPLAQLDLYYHVRLREPDQFGDGLLPSVWYTTALVSSAGRVAHSLGASLAYQPTSSLLVRAGFEGVVAGCSVPVEVKANLFISASF